MFFVSYQNPFVRDGKWRPAARAIGRKGGTKWPNMQKQSHTSNLYVGGQFNVSMFYYSWPFTCSSYQDIHTYQMLSAASKAALKFRHNKSVAYLLASIICSRIIQCYKDHSRKTNILHVDVCYSCNCVHVFVFGLLGYLCIANFTHV